MPLEQHWGFIKYAKRLRWKNSCFSVDVVQEMKDVHHRVVDIVPIHLMMFTRLMYSGYKTGRNKLRMW